MLRLFVMAKYSLNLEKAEKYLRTFILEAGEILEKYFRLEKLSKKPKGEHDLVTEADLAVDEFVIKKLKKEFPDIPVLTEETSDGNFGRYKKAEFVWVVDPLDGTTNFSRRLPHFAISIALVSKSYSILGAVYNPVYGNLYWAREDGEGAFLNGKKIFVSKETKPKKSIVCLDWSHEITARGETLKTVEKLLGKVGHIKMLGSAATDIVHVACGKIEAYVHSRCMPWDYAAAALIADRAGAKVTDIEGKKWNVFIPSILVANPIFHQKILEFLL